MKKQYRRTKLFNYRNEAAFSKAVVAAFKTRKHFAQRIESGGTGRGIPDLYVIVNNQAIWLELKRVHKNIDRYETIPWRPGQQSWLHEVTVRKQLAFTLCCFDDCILQINHDILYLQDVVDTYNNGIRHYSLKDIVS